MGPLKIRPYDPPLELANPPVLCAKNEYCSFQLVITAAGEDLESMDVELNDLTGTRKAIIPSNNATIFLQRFLNISYISDKEGMAGEWPDPLVPKVDPDLKEVRNGFPFSIRRVSPAYKQYATAPKGVSAVPGQRGYAEAISGGNYRGNAIEKFVVKITQPGTIGTAKFIWSTEPSGRPSSELPVLATPTELSDGVSISFRSGDKGDQDFLVDDTFWIFAGPYRHQPIWIDILIPKDARPGMYSGKLRVLRQGQSWKEIPLQLEILDFALPSTSSLANYFGVYAQGLNNGHYGPEWNGERIQTLLKLYATAALRNSITISGGHSLPPSIQIGPDGKLQRADFRAYDDLVGAFLDGKDTPRGAKWTSVGLPKLAAPNPEFEAERVRAFVEHMKQRGWYDRLFDYTYDEPRKPEQFRALEQRARMLMTVAPEVPRLVTTDLNPQLYGLVTRWCPLVNNIDPRHVPWRTPKHPGRSEYDARIKAGDQLWWYQSCMSHGCGFVGGPPEYQHWPSYMVDASAIRNRVFGFLSAVTYRISGVLYWDVAHSYLRYAHPGNRYIDLWESVFDFGGNGDGNLFYPGRPDQVGGQHHIPIESLRLKMIRDSFYDADLATLLRDAGESQFLEAEVGRVVKKTYEYSDDPQAWAQLREKLMRRLAARKAPSLP